MAFTKDNFRSDALFSAKLMGRNIYAAKRRFLNSLTTAKNQSVQELHRRLPEFRTAFELENGLWKGDDWLGTRIGRESQNKENKESQMRLQPLVNAAVQANIVFPTWGDWETYVYQNLGEVIPRQFLYICPHKRLSGSGYFLQKVGVTTNLVQRHCEYRTWGPKSTPPVCEPIHPSPTFILTCDLGAISKEAARTIEKDCMFAIGKTPSYGLEWFEVTPLSVMIAVSGVLVSKGYRQGKDGQIIVHEEIATLTIAGVSVVS